MKEYWIDLRRYFTNGNPIFIATGRGFGSAGWPRSYTFNSAKDLWSDLENLGVSLTDTQRELLFNGVGISIRSDRHTMELLDIWQSRDK